MNEYLRAKAALEAATSEAEADAVFLGIKWGLVVAQMPSLTVVYLTVKARLAEDDGR
jgi:hypothetical protein